MPSLFVYQVDGALSQSRGNFKEAWTGWRCLAQMLGNVVKLSAQKRVFSPLTPRNKRTQNRRMLSRLMIRNLHIRGRVLGKLFIKRLGSSLQRDARGLHNINHEA